MRTVDILDDYMTRNLSQDLDTMTARYDNDQTTANSQVRYLASIVYALLSHCTSGAALATVNKATGDSLNGYEAFRHLNEHYAMNDTNKALVSTTHRVVNPPAPWSERSRFSMPYFLHFNPDFSIETLPGCVQAAGVNHFPEPITSQAYLEERLREIGLLTSEK